MNLMNFHLDCCLSIVPKMHVSRLKASNLHLQVEGVKPEQEKARLFEEAPVRQSNEEMMKVLESARRTFFVETGRPTLDSNPANVSSHVPLFASR